MHKVDAPGATAGNEFTDGDPQTGTAATTLEAKFMNTLQRELVNIVEEENIALDDEDDTQVHAAIRSMLNNVIVPGTRMLFVQASAPPGWTQDNSLNDRVIRVVNNEGIGGDTGGNWTVSGLNVQGHALTIDDMPEHNHGGGRHMHRTLAHGFGDAPGTNFSRRTLQYPQANAGSTSYTNNVVLMEGGGREHGHGLSSDASWRPAYVDVIACIKNETE